MNEAGTNVLSEFQKPGQHNERPNKNIPIPGIEKYNQYRITTETDIPVPVSIVTIDNELVCTQGNITTISGGVKSGKSAITSWLIAGALSATGELIDALDRLQVAPNPTHKAVIHADTEQSKYKQQKNQRTILKRCGFEKTPKHFMSYNIRGLQVEDCQTFLTEIFDIAAKEFNGIHLAVIDGIADFINDVNDPVASFEIVQTLMQLSEKYNTSIIVIIHTNPNSDKERGNLGSICLRKSESILTIKKDGNISSLETKHMREAGDLPPLQFIYCKEKHYHIGIDAVDSPVIDKDSLRLQQLKEIAKSALPPPVSYKYNEAISKIMQVSKKSERTAKDYLKEMGAHQMVTQGADKNYRLNIAA